MDTQRLIIVRNSPVISAYISLEGVVVRVPTVNITIEFPLMTNAPALIRVKIFSGGQGLRIIGKIWRESVLF